MLRTQRWPQLLTFMLALACSASLVLLGSQRLQADHLDLAGPLGRSSIRVNVAATAQCLASNKLLRENTVRLGSEMDDFGEGLLLAAGVKGSKLNLSRKLAGHSPTVCAVLKAIICSQRLTSLDLRHNDGSDLDVRMWRLDVAQPCSQRAQTQGMTYIDIVHVTQHTIGFLLLL